MSLASSTSAPPVEFDKADGAGGALLSADEPAEVPDCLQGVALTEIIEKMLVLERLDKLGPLLIPLLLLLWE